MRWRSRWTATSSTSCTASRLSSANYCTKCGELLEDCERILDYVTQVVSIPELKPVVKEIRHYITVCKKCGERI